MARVRRKVGIQEDGKPPLTVESAPDTAASVSVFVLDDVARVISNPDENILFDNLGLFLWISLPNVGKGCIKAKREGIIFRKKHGPDALNWHRANFCAQSRKCREFSCDGARYIASSMSSRPGIARIPAGAVRRPRGAAANVRCTHGSCAAASALRRSAGFLLPTALPVAS